MGKYIIIINHRTLFSLIIVIATFLVGYNFKLYYNIDLTLVSIAIIFPLVFNIRSSYRRREKALEHLSQFRSTLVTIHNFFMSANSLSEIKKQEITNILLEISDKLVFYLRSKDKIIKDLDLSTQKIFQFVVDNKEFISARLKDRVLRFLSNLHESIENTNAIHVHRTPISLKAYCMIFIYLFPLVYTPTVIYQIGPDTSIWVSVFVVMFSQFILVALYNIQDQLEYPFDNVGMDDINLDIFKFDR